VKVSSCPQKNDMKSDTRQVKSKASNAKQIGNTTTTSNSFDALGSMGDMDEDMGSKMVEKGGRSTRGQDGYVEC
ncbi:hypothetical protein Tco_1299551, partial [Tanacetum coccineum]